MTSEVLLDQNGRKALPQYLDPTTNVLALVTAAVKRLDDIQKVEMRRVDEKLENHIQYTKELAEAESKRIDAIRTVDVAAVSVANDRAIAQAAVLAKQVVESAEALRNMVSLTATTVASNLQGLQNQLSERISALEKTSNKGEGRQGISSSVLMVIAAIVGGIVTFIIQVALKH